MMFTYFDAPIEQRPIHTLLFSMIQVRQKHEKHHQHCHVVWLSLCLAALSPAIFFQQGCFVSKREQLSVKVLSLLFGHTISIDFHNHRALSAYFSLSTAGILGACLNLEVRFNGFKAFPISWNFLETQEKSSVVFCLVCIKRTLVPKILQQSDTHYTSVIHYDSNSTSTQEYVYMRYMHVIYTQKLVSIYSVRIHFTKKMHTNLPNTSNCAIQPRLPLLTCQEGEIWTTDIVSHNS